MARNTYVSATEKLRDNAPKIAINVGIAVLIWLIGNYVFIPISRGLFIEAYAVTQLVSIIILVAMFVLVLSIINELRNLADAAAGLAAYQTSMSSGQMSAEEVGSYRTAFRGLLYVLVVAAAFLLFSLQLNFIHPALAAIVLLGVTAWAVVTLFRSGRALSNVVDRYSRQWTDRLTSRARGEESR
ncbi:MAG: hypothetical protein M1503_00220 [Thaumarchaeota archaeon]|nr:hypothetical protein [Nitrososphaerota archaeon]MCL5316676.1 hypothetical protein [Nitrososphaerota archaeon]